MVIRDVSIHSIRPLRKTTTTSAINYGFHTWIPYTSSAANVDYSPQP